MKRMDCDFCNRLVLKRQGIYDGDKVFVVYPRSPVIREHFMVIPTRHVETLKGLREEELLESIKIVNKIFLIFEQNESASGFNLFTNVGKKAGQHVPHFHWHLFIRFDDEKTSPHKVLNDSALKEEVSSEEWKKRRNRISLLLRGK